MIYVLNISYIIGYTYLNYYETPKSEKTACYIFIFLEILLKHDKFVNPKLVSMRMQFFPRFRVSQRSAHKYVKSIGTS